MISNNTWILIYLSLGYIAINSKWVYKIKYELQGDMLQYKARWVVRGFQQKESINYVKTFASVVKSMSYKAIFANLAAKDWDVHQMDIKTACLYGFIEGKV